MGSWLFGRKTTQPPSYKLRVNTSIQGVAIPRGWGQTRLGSNLLWYGDFSSHGSSSTGGGKGGVTGGGKGQAAAGTTYSASVVAAVAQSGPNPVPASLLHFDGANNSTVFLDVSPAHAWVAGGGAKIDTSQSVFGGASGRFAAGPDYVLGDGSADFAFGSADFTVDFWFRLNATGATQMLYDARGAAMDAAPVIYVTSANKLNYFTGGSDRVVGTTTLATGAWHHTAVTRQSGTTRLFLDGAQQGASYVDANMYIAARPALGVDYTLAAGAYNGWLDELRVVKGRALWVAAFATPNAAYPANNAVGSAISDVVGCWNNKAFGTPAAYGFTKFLGSSVQSAWSYLTTAHPTQALTYREIAYLAQANMNLGGMSEFPQLSWEVKFAVNSALLTAPDLWSGVSSPSSIPDANPRDVLVDFFLNDVGWPLNRLDVVMSDYSTCCLALGLLISPVLVEQREGISFIDDVLAATNAGARWSGGKLSVVPWYDQPVTSGTVTSSTQTYRVPTPPSPLPGGTQLQPTVAVATGQFVADLGVTYVSGGASLTKLAYSAGTVLSVGQYVVSPAGVYRFSVADEGVQVNVSWSQAAVTSYSPNLTPIYDFSDSNLLTNEGGGGSGEPVSWINKRPLDVFNNVKVEFLDRNNSYDPSVAEAKDQASIDAFGLRSRDVKQSHMFCLGGSAQMSATLQLGREAIQAPIVFTVGSQYVLLDVEDLVTVTRPTMGLARQLVRITEIQETSSGNFVVTAEEVQGTASPPLYGAQASLGPQANYNVSPGNVNAPIIFEPPDELGGGLVIWGAVSGSDPNWGGCQVWASYDNVSYQQIGTIHGSARMGVITATLPSVIQAAVGQTIDATSTLSVSLVESNGSLTSGSSADLTAFNTKCYVDGEIIAYQTATLTGTNAYNLTTLNRGGYSTTISSHAGGSAFARLDQGIFTDSYDATRIGSTIYFKFLSFNQWGGGQQALSDVGAYTYVIQGTAVSSPLPNVVNFVSTYVGGFLYLDWDIVQDFRSPVRYEIRKGTTWESASYVGTYAHPHIIVTGDDNYLIKAVWTSPITGGTAYSSGATALNVTGSQLTSLPGNLLVSVIADAGGEGWSGTFSGDIYSDGTDVLTVFGTAIVTNTKCLLHFNGPNNSTTFLDSVGGHVFTANSGAKIDTSQSVFPNASGKFNGSSDYINGDGSSDFAFGTGDFTIDFWIRLNATGASVNIYDSRASGVGSSITPVIYIKSSNVLAFFVSGSDQITGTTVLTTGTWYHVAVARASGSTKLFLNGTQEGSTYTDANNYIVGANRPCIARAGDASAGFFNGWIDELRVVKGTAIWSANFSVPPAASSSGTGTYTFPSADTTSVGRLAPCLVQFSYAAGGQAPSSDFFNPGAPDNNDVFAHSDIFDTVLAQYVTAEPQVSVSTDGSTFGSYVKWVAGTYNLWKVKARIVLTCTNPENVQGILSTLSWSVYAPTRTDHPLVNSNIGTGVTTVTFAPDGGSTAAFNGGPNGGTTTSSGKTVPSASVPSLQAVVNNRTAGDEVFFTSLSLSSVGVQVKNGGSGVSRNISLQVWGF